MGPWSHVSVVRREYDVGSWQIARDRVFLGHMLFLERVRVRETTTLKWKREAFMTPFFVMGV